MEKKPRALTVRPARVVVLTPAEQISSALAKGSNLAELKGLLELQKDYEAFEAKKAYNVAMADFKATPLKILKDKKVSYSTSAGNVNYNHASLANVVEKISAELSKHGLSASWVPHQENKEIKITCRITHVKGHSEEASLSAPADATGSKNNIQQIGSTITYLERYTLLGLTGLATYDQDNDGKTIVKVGEKSVDTGAISDKELSNLRDLMIDAEANEKAFIGLLKVAKLEDLPKDKLEFAKKTLAGIKASHNR